MRKKCKDCDKPVATDASIRCFDCKVKLRRETQKLNKLKYQYHKTPKHRYATYKRGAIARGYVFELTEKEFLSLWNKPCEYCSEPIEGIGIDRKDNNVGYLFENVVSCCTTCNMMKHKMTHEQFIKKCKQIAGVLPV